MSKTLEKLVYGQSMSHLEQNDLLCHFHCDFHRNRFAELAVLTTDEDGNLTGCVY